MIKAIFFDLDGVLTIDAKGSLTLSKNLCEAFPHLSVEEILACYREDIELLNTGQRTLEEVWDRLCRRFKIPKDEALPGRILREVPVNDAMLALARSLSHCYTLGIITDNCRERMDALEDAMKLKELRTYAFSRHKRRVVM